MNKNGFTLVEMLATMIIIALLTALLIPGYIFIYTQVRRNSLDSKIKQIETAALKYGNRIKDEVKYKGVDCYDTSVEFLIQKGYLVSDKNAEDAIYNPTNGAKLDGQVKICYCSSKLDIVANYVTDFNVNQMYYPKDKVKYNNKIYECIKEAPIGSFSLEYFKEVEC